MNSFLDVLGPVFESVQRFQIRFLAFLDEVQVRTTDMKAEHHVETHLFLHTCTCTTSEEFGRTSYKPKFCPCQTTGNKINTGNFQNTSLTIIYSLHQATEHKDEVMYYICFLHLVHNHPAVYAIYPTVSIISIKSHF